LPVYRSPSRSAKLLHLSVLLTLPQHIPPNCTAAHCTIAAVWLPLFHTNFPSCLSLPADCHLPLGVTVILTLHGHERRTAPVLHVNLTYKFLHPLPPKEILPPLSHNNSSCGSNLRSTLYMWSAYLYGLINPQYLTKCPYLSHHQHSVSVSPNHLIAQLPHSFPIQTVLHRVLLN